MSQRHEIKPGECVASLAPRFGLAPETIWNHPENEALRGDREHPTVLGQGDALTIPDPEPKVVEAASGRRHRFKRKGVPVALRMRFLDDEGKPRAGLSWELVLPGERRAGETDGDGTLFAWIPPEAERGLLLLEDEETIEELVLKLGHLAPVSQPEGVASRLKHLGYSPDALAAFQRDHGLDPTGEADEVTRTKLVEVYGS